MPKAMVRLSAGRRELGEAVQALCFLAGANSVFYGDKLLTTGNPDALPTARSSRGSDSRPRGEAVLGRRRRCGGNGRMVPREPAPRGFDRMSLIADLERELATRAADRACARAPHARLAARRAGRRRRPRGHRVREQRLSGSRQRSGDRRGGARRRVALRRGRGRVAPDQRPLCAARIARSASSPRSSVRVRTRGRSRSRRAISPISRC